MDFTFVQTDDVIFTITLKAGKINRLLIQCQDQVNKTDPLKFNLLL